MDEYISREELRKHLKECYDDELFDVDMKKAVIGIDIYVENMPSADVQPVKHGRWILCDDGYVRCSECNCKAFIENDETILTDFCHGCGANMRMGGDSDD